MVEDHRKLPPTTDLTTPTDPPTSTLPPAVAAADCLSEVAGADSAPAGADTDPVAAVRSEAAALLGAGRSPLGMLLTTCKHTEATTPYHPWRAVFERLFTEDTLRSFVALCDRGSPSPSRPPPQARPPPSPLRGSPLRIDGGTSPAASSGRASFGRASFLRGGSSPPSARPLVRSIRRGGSPSSFCRRRLQPADAGAKEAPSERPSRARVSFDDEGYPPKSAAVEADGRASPASFPMGSVRPPPTSVRSSDASSSTSRTGAGEEASFSSVAEHRTFSPAQPTHGGPEGARRAGELPSPPHVPSRLTSSSAVQPAPPSPPPSPSPVAPRALLPLRAARASPRASPHLSLLPTLPPPPTSWPAASSAPSTSWPPASPPTSPPSPPSPSLPSSPRQLSPSPRRRPRLEVTLPSASAPPEAISGSGNSAPDVGGNNQSRALAKFRKRSCMMISAQRIMRKTHSLTIEEALGEKGRPGSDLSDSEKKAELERALRIFSRFRPSPQRGGNSLAKQRWQRAYSSVIAPHTTAHFLPFCLLT